jgi:hypothetical protein
LAAGVDEQLEYGDVSGLPAEEVLMVRATEDNVGLVVEQLLLVNKRMRKVLEDMSVHLAEQNGILVHLASHVEELEDRQASIQYQVDATVERVDRLERGS